MPMLSFLNRFRRKSPGPRLTGWLPAARMAREPFPEELVSAYRDTAYFCANMNARAVGRTPLRLYVRTSPGQLLARCPVAPVVGKRRRAALRSHGPADGGAETVAVDEVLAHPLLALLRRPCHDGGVPLLAGGEFMELTQLALEMVGRAYWQIVRDGLGVPTGLWPLQLQSTRVPQPTNWLSSLRSVNPFRAPDALRGNRHASARQPPTNALGRSSAVPQWVRKVNHRNESG